VEEMTDRNMLAQKLSDFLTAMTEEFDVDMFDLIGILENVKLGIAHSICCETQEEEVDEDVD